jgi:type VI secretion system secreted protein VgrG
MYAAPFSEVFSLRYHETLLDPIIFPLNIHKKSCQNDQALKIDLSDEAYAMLTTQENIDFTIETPLGKDALILDRFDGVEQISEPFCFSLEMNSASPDLDLTALVGKEVQITYEYGGEKRHFCGVVGTAEQGWTVRKGANNFTYYYAKVYPKFWMLKFTRDYKIFQNKSAMDIIKEVLSDNGVTEIEDKTSSCGKRVREYCVQYGESCFDFISRLFEEEGIFYFFKHSSSNHTMVICDDSLGAKDVSPDKIEFLKSYGANPPFNMAYTLRMQEQVVPKKFAAADFNFETPDTHLFNKVTGEGEGGQIYDYPGIFMKTNEGDLITNHRIQFLEWAKTTLSGKSTTPTFCSMFAFTLADHPRSDWNDKYVLYRVHHRIQQNAAEGEDLYENEFVAFPADVPFRAPRVTKKPLIYSTQTAIVTTKSGEEIWCDEYGRIKVHFHWDQYGTKDEKSSCWIRVAQLWAGNNWGGMFTPRIGMEVVVTFLDGDPDRPLITGCVYNGKNANPYAKSEPTKSTIKSDTTKGGGGFNEFRYEDKKGSEQIYLHAQKDWDSEVEHSRTLLIKTGDDTTTIKKGKRLVTLNGGDKGDDTLILENGDQTIKITGERSITVTKDNTLKVTGNLLIDVTGNITIKSAANVTIKSGANMTLDAGANMILKSGANMSLLAAASLSLKGAMLAVAGKAGASMDGGSGPAMMKGLTATVKGDTVAVMQGTMATVKGDAMAVVTAPVVAIG